jgi:Uma2 family endonuclease
MAMPHARPYTVADLAAMPDDGQRYEIIDGELFVTPAPTPGHQMVLTPLIISLHSYLAAHGLQRQLLTAPADVTLGENTLVQPDLLVADTSTVLRSNDWTDLTTLYLVVEVTSPSTARTDRTRKRIAYMQSRVPTYWVVDPASRQIEVWTPDAADAVVHHEACEWRHPLATQIVVIDVEALFRLE